MNAWKQSALYAYYLASLPLRQVVALKQRSNRSSPVRIVFYHRVADHQPNDWTISTRSFTRQIRWLRRRFDIVSLAEAQWRIAAGANSRPTACITFDDGYADNVSFALPLLTKYGLPYTYFVSTEFVQTDPAIDFQIAPIGRTEFVQIDRMAFVQIDPIDRSLAAIVPVSVTTRSASAGHGACRGRPCAIRLRRCAARRARARRGRRRRHPSTSPPSPPRR